MLRLFVFALVLLLDISSKFWVAAHLPPIDSYMGYPFGGMGLLNTAFFKVALVHTTNTGVAWGLLANLGHPLLIFRILITLAILIYLLFLHPPKSVRLPLTLVLAGAVGNIVDFFIHGHVIDMISLIFHRYCFPIFNVADAAIFIGIAWLVILKPLKLDRHASSS